MAKLPYKKIQEAVTFVKATREEAITLANDIPNDAEVHALVIQKGFTASPDPVGYMVVPLAKKWKGITDKEAHALYAKYSAWDLIKAVEALLREKNGG